MYLSEYLLHYAKSECLKLGLVMLKKSQTLKTTVIDILKKHKNSVAAQKDFNKRCPPAIEDQFKRLVADVRNLELEL